MIKWIDIVSPNLRTAHQRWCGLRERSFIPHLRTYNNFAPSVPDDVSVTVLFPANGAAPAFRHVGRSVTRDYPSLHDGMRFSDIQPLLERTFVTIPFHEVRLHRQPECRRGNTGGSARGRPYEQLLIPFGDDQFRVCLVHAIYDFGPGR